MASFYSPYSKYPDFGQGIGDLAMQLMQMMLMKKYLGQGQQPMKNPAGAGAGAGGAMPTQMGPQIPQMGGGASAMGAGQIDPQVLAYLKMLGIL